MAGYCDLRGEFGEIPRTQLLCAGLASPERDGGSVSVIVSVSAPNDQLFVGAARASAGNVRSRRRSGPLRPRPTRGSRRATRPRPPNRRSATARPRRHAGPGRRSHHPRRGRVATRRASTHRTRSCRRTRSWRHRARGARTPRPEARPRRATAARHHRQARPRRAAAARHRRLRGPPARRETAREQPNRGLCANRRDPPRLPTHPNSSPTPAALGRAPSYTRSVRKGPFLTRGRPHRTATAERSPDGQGCADRAGLWRRTPPLAGPAAPTRPRSGGSRA